MPTSRGTLTRMSRSTRTASVAGRRPGAVAVMSITLPPGISAHLGAELASVDLGVAAADAHRGVGRRDRPAHGDRLRAHGAAVARDVELQAHTRLGRRLFRLAAGGEHETGREQADQAAHPIDANRAVAPSDGV